MWDYTCYKWVSEPKQNIITITCHFQFSENGDTKTVWFSRFCLQCDFFLRNFALGNQETGTVSVRRAPDKNDKPYFLRASPTDKFALGKWFTITVSHIWCEMFSTSIWHSLFPSCESYEQICTWKSETGTVSVRRAPDKNDKPYFLRASPTDKFALENQRRVFREPLSLLSAHVRTCRS